MQFAGALITNSVPVPRAQQQACATRGEYVMAGIPGNAAPKISSGYLFFIF
jgi:hypothetical protein